MSWPDWALRKLGLAEFQSSGKWFLLSFLIGVVAGVGAIAFQFTSQTVSHYALERLAGYSSSEPAGESRIYPHENHEFVPWKLMLVIVAGGLVSGWLVYTYAPEAEGHGTDAAIESFHQKRGFIRARIPLIKMLASAITIGTGGSGGREGPIAQIGAGFGSFLATKLQLSSRDRRIMLAAGMGAGVGAIFRAPLAGALFAAEILYRDADLESEVIVPAAISSIIGYSVFSFSLPAGKRFLPLFGDHLHYSFQSPWELIPLSLMSVVLVIVGIFYIKSFYGTHKLFKKVPVPRIFRPAIGAFLAGLVGLGLYYAGGKDPRYLAVLSTGYGALQGAVENADGFGIQLLLTVAIFKIATTSLTISSGGSGGVFGPSMVIGGCLGGAIGIAFNNIFPQPVPRAEVFAIVGMAGFFSGCARAPISTIIMVSEMSGDYQLLIPTMWVSTLCFILCHRWTLYEKQVPSRLESPAHRGDFIVDVLEGIRVSDVPSVDRKTVAESATLRDILQMLPESRQNYFPVINEQDSLVGIFSTDDVRSFLYDEAIWQLAVARDIMTTKMLTISPEDDLNTAMRRFTERNLDELPIVIKEGSIRKLVGMLRRKDAISHYNRLVLEQKKHLAEAM